ncbi:MAG TPA: HAMP domain-containing sensor histidine kinase [Xanthobacteraceae bacterium]|nr:HAMP domain-containing sensor histidine kinase [Xanthobacteraceae bacterium]
MSQLALVCPTVRDTPSSAAQRAHDIRNTLTTVGLHLDTLERLAGTQGHKAVEAAHALIRRATAMCEQALAEAAQAAPADRRRAVDLVETARHVAGLLAPAAPDRFEVRVHATAPFKVMADAAQVFRILFNLLHNAVAVARRQGGITTVDVAIARSGPTVTVRIADDGPGLPATVRRRLFRPGASAHGSGGIGLAIARELAEQNGGVLALAPSAKGTTFVLELPAAAAAAARDNAVTRSLGRRAA